MLALDDPQWKALTQAYGRGDVIAAWLQRLVTASAPETARKIFWENDILYGSLCHQDTTYTATYAAIPHLVDLAGTLQPHEQLRSDLLEFVGYCAGNASAGREIPDTLRPSYEAALQRSRPLIGETLTTIDKEDALQALTLALAGVTGNQNLFDYYREFYNDPCCPDCGELLICPECQAEDND